MPIDFPASPSVGQTYVYGGVTYTYTAQGSWSSTIAPAVFPSGSLALFLQSSAPAGWTKQTAHNDKSLRIVSGTAASGGSISFSTLFARTAVDISTVTVSQMAAHRHNIMFYPSLSGGASNTQTAAWAGEYIYLQAAGSDVGHTHTIDMRVQYVDAIIASKS